MPSTGADQRRFLHWRPPAWNENTSQRAELLLRADIWGSGEQGSNPPRRTFQVKEQASVEAMSVRRDRLTVRDSRFKSHSVDL